MYSKIIWTLFTVNRCYHFYAVRRFETYKDVPFCRSATIWIINMCSILTHCDEMKFLSICKIHVSLIQFICTWPPPIMFFALLISFLYHKFCKIIFYRYPKSGKFFFERLLFSLRPPIRYHFIRVLIPKIISVIYREK